MLKITVANNVKREVVIVENDTTPREVLEGAGIAYDRGTTHLDGAPLMPGQMDMTFEELGIKSACFLVNIVKADNAAK